MKETANTADQGGPSRPPPGVWCPTSISTHLPDPAALHHGSKEGFPECSVTNIITARRAGAPGGGRGLLGAVRVLVANSRGICTPRAPDTGSQGDKITPVENLLPKQTGKVVVSCGLSADDQRSKKPAGRVQLSTHPCVHPASSLPPLSSPQLPEVTLPDASGAFVLGFLS